MRRALGDGHAFGVAADRQFPSRRRSRWETAKAGIRVEADLAKAGVEQLVPGWVKAPRAVPASSPSRCSEGIDRRSGPAARQRPASLRGTATLSADGGLDKADLRTFKLSAGDDMRAQIERNSSLYKVDRAGQYRRCKTVCQGVRRSAPPEARDTAAAAGIEGFRPRPVTSTS